MLDVAVMPKTRVIPWWESANARLCCTWPDDLSLERDLIRIAHWLETRGQRPVIVPDTETTEHCAGIYLYVMPIRDEIRPAGNVYSIADRDRAIEDLRVFIEGYRAGHGAP